MLPSEPIIINFRGGIISPGYLKDVMDIASESMATHASFGLRQQLLINIPAKKYKEFTQKCNEKNISFYEADSAAPNIVSSYCAVNIFAAESWLSEGVYKDVFDLFNYQPSLKINICDSKQSLIPFFSGHINSELLTYP